MTVHRNAPESEPPRQKAEVPSIHRRQMGPADPSGGAQRATQLPLDRRWRTVGLREGSPKRSGIKESTRALLELLQRLTGLESVYVTEIDWETEKQVVTVSRNSGSLELDEGTTWAWADGICRRALEGGPRYTTDVPGTYSDSGVASELGIITYAMCPILVGEEHAVFGTLCGASAASRPVDDASRDILDLFAEIIGSQIDLEHASERREARALATERRIHERAQFLAIAEHKLKTPLTVIRGWSDLLHSQRATTFSDTHLQEGIQAIWRNARALGVLVDELLEEATADVQAREVHVRRNDLAGFIESMVDEFGGMSDQHPLVTDVPSPLDAWFDRAALHQALGHLLDNAVKYSPSGGQIVVRARPVSDRVEIDIVDRGAGIPPGLDVFAPFTRGDESVPGVGLGLHIVRRIIESMNGTVDGRRNEDGSGSTFRIQLRGAG